MNSKRVFDIIMVILLIGLFCFPLIIIMIMIKVSSRGPFLFWSERIGINNIKFKMPKFRTMRIDTPVVATHLLKNPEKYLTAVGSFLRKFSLDEIPQIWSVSKGDMSFVGPRPALFNQDDLIALRTKKGVHKIIPGITGWAQINGRDELTIPQKVEYDQFYMNNKSNYFDFKIILLTLMKVLSAKGVKH